MQIANCKLQSEVATRDASWHQAQFAICNSQFAICNSILRFLAFLIGLLLTGVLSADEPKPVEADILLKGGTLLDGSGVEGQVGDIAIKDDRIVGVGQFPVKSAKWQIECRDLIVAPGFIDLHNHSDSQIVSPRTRANVNYLMQGCTTVVTGNCGSGPIDVAEYYSKISAAGAGTNVIHLLPQGALRGHVVGSAQRTAKPDEIAKMRELAEKAMKDGAWGMSTGLIYVPSSYADTAELIEITKIIARHGGIYASHIRGEGKELLESIQEAIKIGREAGCPVHVSHFKASGQDAWGLIRPAAEMIETARKDGMKVTADQYPYIASSTSLDATVLPTWSLAGGRDKLLERLKDKEQSTRIVEFVTDKVQKARDGAAIKIATFSAKPAWIGRSLADIATAENATPLDIALTIIRSGGAGVVNFGMSEEDVRFAMALPWVATASDGRAFLPSADKPHPRSYGTFSRKLGLYALQEKVISLPAAIRSSTSLPAEILGLPDRGSLKVGHFADVVVFDPKTIRDTATFDDPHQYATGMKFVFVNGEVAVHDGTPTGALGGRALKRPDGK
jgi:N-acyl-D-amino-acid deacylase